MNHRTFAGVIFDFNGVLLWDNHLHEEAWRRYSAQLRGAPLSDEEMKHQVHGRVNRDIFAYLLGRPPQPAELEAMLDEKESLYRRLAVDAGDAYRLSPGATDLLDWLAAHAVPRAIATSSPWVNVAFFIERLALRHWFVADHIIYDRGHYPGKPAPGIYLEAAARLGLPPEQCVVVEDSIAGIQSAHAAGVGEIIAIGPPDEHRALRAIPGVGAAIGELTHFPLEILETWAG
jgi:beta-phosphoglucomutase-like phosphatase (HAD superfamily)